MSTYTEGAVSLAGLAPAVCPGCEQLCALWPMRHRPGTYRLVGPDGHKHRGVCPVLSAAPVQRIPQKRHGQRAKGAAA